jgi:glycosyltransferase involved in cell wall biosynthesis
LIPAFNEADRIADTIAAVREIPGITEIVVIDDGSSDATSDEARAAGADRVITLAKNSGKGAALAAGLRETESEVVVMLDADLGRTAGPAAALLAPVLEDRADMTVAVFPKVAGSGGLGFAVWLATVGILRFTGRKVEAPLSGQRALRREIIDRMNGFDRGFGVEVGLTIDALRMGYRLLEVPVDLTHRHTGKTLRGFLHRGRQFRDIAWALFVRDVGLRRCPPGKTI